MKRRGKREEVKGNEVRGKRLYGKGYGKSLSNSATSNGKNQKRQTERIIFVFNSDVFACHRFKKARTTKIFVLIPNSLFK